jgi:hypothetical protein
VVFGREPGIRFAAGVAADAGDAGLGWKSLISAVPTELELQKLLNPQEMAA